MSWYSPGEVSLREAAFLAGGTHSARINLLGKRLVGIEMPSSWVTANITFLGSADGTKYSSIYDAAGSEIFAVVAAGRNVILDPALFAGFGFIQLRSGTSSTPVTQTNAVTPKLITREV